ncbi:MAG: NAD(P)H-hydrate epimerase [Acidobacteria bacterium]|nr:NAD(P)H-hydrate epimerase [Acidobacteriota bacterium]
MSTASAATVLQFFSETGIAVPAVTAKQMREVDRIAMEETGPNLYQMMENAGRDLALLVIELLGRDWQSASVVVLAGAGGNGGGGICAARHLANQGCNVTLCLADPARLGEVPTFQRKGFQSTCGKVVKAAALRTATFGLIVDALIGYGLRAAPREAVAELIGWANGAKTPILSLDVPSGMDATTGKAPGGCIRPRWTMTLALPKTGLLPERTGELFLADIGIPQGVYRRVGLNYIAPFGGRSWVRLDHR